MPAHIYMRTGDYAGAVKANAAAVDVDRKYIAATKAEGVYPAMYCNFHNLDFSRLGRDDETGSSREASRATRTKS